MKRQSKTRVSLTNSLTIAEKILFTNRRHQRCIKSVYVRNKATGLPNKLFYDQM